MCGITGFVGLGALDDLHRMTERLLHRGPDVEGLWFDPEKAVYLGHRRLSILDITGGSQPMQTKDGSLLVIFNGEIYNHLELRNVLESKGYSFVTDHSDTEVLLHGYRAWGKNLPSKLNGMWAFVLYDRENNTIFCSRDRFGKKPFFYTHQNNTLVFASEISAVATHSQVSTALSTLALKKYFGYGYIPTPYSIYQNIYKLPAGCSIIYDIDTNKLTVIKYWDFILEPFQQRSNNHEREWAEQLLELLDRSVQRRLVSDVPLGVFLSGGVDSSAIAALACRHIKSSSHLNTFSIGFDEPDFDESRYAQQVSMFLGTQHYEEKLSLEKSRRLLPEIIAKLDEPIGDSSLLPTYLLCRFAREKITVALGGDGGDELFAGYDPFQALKWADWYSKIVPQPIHQGIKMLLARLPVSHRNMSLDFKIKRTLRGLSYAPTMWNAVWLSSLSPKELEELFAMPIELEELYSEAITQWEACQQSNLIDKTLQFYTKLYLQDNILVKLDRASMMVSLEARLPFLDIEFVDFVRRIPSEYKFRHGQTKYLLKKSLEAILPKEIIYRPKKGFGVPISKWFFHNQLPFENSATLPLSQDFIKKKIREHEQQRVDHRAFLWSLWVLSSWWIKKNG